MQALVVTSPNEHESTKFEESAYAITIRMLHELLDEMSETDDLTRLSKKHKVDLGKWTLSGLYEANCSGDDLADFLSIPSSPHLSNLMSDVRAVRARRSREALSKVTTMLPDNLRWIKVEYRCDGKIREFNYTHSQSIWGASIDDLQDSVLEFISRKWVSRRKINRDSTPFKPIRHIYDLRGRDQVPLITRMHNVIGHTLYLQSDPNDPLDAPFVATTRVPFILPKPLEIPRIRYIVGNIRFRYHRVLEGTIQFTQDDDHLTLIGLFRKYEDSLKQKYKLKGRASDWTLLDGCGTLLNSRDFGSCIPEVLELMSSLKYIYLSEREGDVPDNTDGIFEDVEFQYTGLRDIMFDMVKDDIVVCMPKVLSTRVLRVYYQTIGGSEHVRLAVDMATHENFAIKYRVTRRELYANFRVIDCGTVPIQFVAHNRHDSHYIMAMPLRRSLRDTVLDRKPPKEERQMWARQLAIELSLLHQYGMLHCNIGPDNVLISDDRKVAQLSDFSAALFKIPEKDNNCWCPFRGNPAFSSSKARAGSTPCKEHDYAALIFTIYWTRNRSWESTYRRLRPSLSEICADDEVCMEISRIIPKIADSAQLSKQASKQMRIQSSHK